MDWCCHLSSYQEADDDSGELKYGAEKESGSKVKQKGESKVKIIAKEGPKLNVRKNKSKLQFTLKEEYQAKEFLK